MLRVGGLEALGAGERFLRELGCKQSFALLFEGFAVFQPGGFGGGTQSSAAVSVAGVTSRRRRVRIWVLMRQPASDLT